MDHFLISKGTRIILQQNRARDLATRKSAPDKVSVSNSKLASLLANLQTDSLIFGNVFLTDFLQMHSLHSDN